MDTRENKGDSDRDDMGAYVPVTSRSGVKRLAAIISKFDDLKRKLVVDIGFGGLLHLPQINVNQRKFTTWLLAHIDPDKRAIVVNDKITLYISEKDVQLFLGIPCGPNKLFGIDTTNVDEKVDFIRLAIGSISNDPEELNSLKAAAEVISKTYPEGMDDMTRDRFKTAFVCFTVGDFLVAKSKANHGVSDFWGSLLNVENIPTYNFCAMVLDEIMHSARKVQYLLKANKSITTVSGCTLFLQGFYLLTRQLGKLVRPANNLPLIAGLDCEKIKKMMMADHAARNVMGDGAAATSSEASETRTVHSKKVSYSAPPKASKPIKKVNRTSETSYLDSYIRGDIERKLTVAQVMDLKWHNARMILHVTAMKSITRESRSIEPTIGRGWSCGTNYAVDAEKANTISNLDRLLASILEDNVQLAKKLHDHGTTGSMSQSVSRNESSGCKRSASEQSFGDSSSDCTSRTKRSNIGRVVQLRANVAEEMTPISDMYLSPTSGDKGVLAYYQEGGPAVEAGKFDSSPRVDSSFHTPSNLKSNVVVTPATTAMHMSEAGLLYRIIEAEDCINLNARSMETQFTDSPIQKIEVKQGQIAKNNWHIGVKNLRNTDDLADKLLVWVLHNESEELDRVWIMHTHPRHIEITGHALKNIIIKGLPFTYELFDLSARRLAQLDRWMYGPGTMLCFRHIFESDFAMMVLANEDPLCYRSIRDQFIAQASYYDISECRMLSVPALVTKTWCGYFWDMELHCVHILDPTFHRTRAEELQMLHDYNVNKIQKALSTCISAMFNGWNIDFTDWPNNYVKPIIAGASYQESGILTLLGIRDFNGTEFVKDHDEESVHNFKAFLLYEDLSIADNCAMLPSGYVQSIDD